MILPLLIPVPVEAITPAGLNRLTQTPFSDSSDLKAIEIDPVSLKKDIENKLAIVNEKLAAMPEEELSAPEQSKLTNSDANWQRRLLLKQLAQVYQGQLDRLVSLQERKKNRLEQESKTAAWSGFGDQPAHPFLLKDKLRESVVRLRNRLKELDALKTVESQADLTLLNDTESAVIKLRQANESLEQAIESSEQQARLIRLRDQLELDAQLKMARLVGFRIEKEIQLESLQATRAMLQLARKQLSEVSDQAELTEKDIDQVYVNLEIEKQRVNAEISNTIAKLDAIQQQKSLANKASQTDTLHSTEKARLAKLGDIDLKLQVLNRIMSLLDTQRDIWSLRWAFANATDRKKTVDAYAKIEKYHAVLKISYQYIFNQRQQAMAMLMDKDDQNRIKPDIRVHALNYVSENLDFDQVVSYSRLLAEIESTESLLARFKEDLDERFHDKKVEDYFEGAVLASVEFLSEFWGLEIFSVEDTVEVDGQYIASQRSVTVGKVVTALAILIIGYWIASRLASFVEGLVVTRLGMDPSLARIARRWILFFEVMLLVVISMLVVRIPLTVFAFMGGAVAIGAGFGMQNLLKNLISGLMLLMERPFRPGDLVVVGGIRGRITDIGVRSSQILDANGIETLVPNSTFIEQNVTNWTLSDQMVRIVVNVGVAYGSSTKEVTRLLQETADRHGLVLEVPPPQVLFEDFGSDALMFGLYVWVQLKQDVSWKAIASDLRFMINKSFEEHDIVIAFPQRDIHLDTSQPIEVRLVTDTHEVKTPFVNGSALDSKPHSF